MGLYSRKRSAKSLENERKRRREYHKRRRQAMADPGLDEDGIRLNVSAGETPDTEILFVMKGLPIKRFKCVHRKTTVRDLLPHLPAWHMKNITYGLSHVIWEPGMDVKDPLPHSKDETNKIILLGDYGLGALKSCQRECNLSRHHPVKDNDTRWSSGHDQMEWFRLHQRAIQLYDINHARRAGDVYKQHQMGLEDWRLNLESVAVLQPIADWTQHMQGTKYPTLPLVLPTIYGLIEGMSPEAPLILSFQCQKAYELMPREMHSGVLKARSSMYDDWVSRWITNLPLEVKRTYAIATPATSASAERLFSVAGRVFGDLRQHMNDKELEAVMWARVNSETRKAAN